MIQGRVRPLHLHDRWDGRIVHRLKPTKTHGPLPGPPHGEQLGAPAPAIGMGRPHFNPAAQVGDLAVGQLLFRRHLQIRISVRHRDQQQTLLQITCDDRRPRIATAGSCPPAYPTADSTPALSARDICNSVSPAMGESSTQKTEHHQHTDVGSFAVALVSRVKQTKLQNRNRITTTFQTGGPVAKPSL